MNFYDLATIPQKIKNDAVEPQIHGWALVRRSRKNPEYDFWSWATTKWCSTLKVVHGWAIRKCAQHLRRCIAKPQKNVLKHLRRRVAKCQKSG